MSTCNQSGTASGNQGKTNKVILNKQVIVLDEAAFQKLDKALTDMLINCDDFYEQIVTNSLVDGIKSQESYLEVFYADKKEVNIGKKQTMTIQSIFIPLSGKYQSNGSLTFFCGNPDYSYQPFINSKGFDKLTKLLEALQSK